MCESTNTVAAVGEFYQRHDPKLAQSLYEVSVTGFNLATQQGFELQGIDEKVALLKACAAGFCRCDLVTADDVAAGIDEPMYWLPLGHRLS